MEQSRRRLGRTENRLRGRRTKRLPIVAAALIIAAGAFLYSADWQRSIDHATPSLGTCKGENASASDCPVLNPVSEPSATSAYRAGGQDSQKVDHLPDTRNRLPRRAWQQDGAASALSPGHTLAELCVVAPDAAVSHCQALTAAGLRSLTDTSDSSDENREPSISGRVLSADGQPLERVSLVAQPERLDDEAIALSANLRFWTTSDAFGAYSFSGLPAGEYMIRSARQGPYLPARVSARSGVDYADLIMSRRLDIRIEGQVVDRFGQPLEGVIVLPTLLGQPDVSSINLRFQMAGYKDQSSKVVVSGHPEPVADEIKVAMDMVDSWTSLKGMVTDDGGQPLAGRRVELRPPTPRAFSTA